MGKNNKRQQCNTCKKYLPNKFLRQGKDENDHICNRCEERAIKRYENNAVTTKKEESIKPLSYLQLPEAGGQIARFTFALSFWLYLQSTVTSNVIICNIRGNRGADSGVKKALILIFSAILKEFTALEFAANAIFDLSSAVLDSTLYKIAVEDTRYAMTHFIQFSIYFAIVKILSSADPQSQKISFEIGGCSDETSGAGGVLHLLGFLSLLEQFGIKAELCFGETLLTTDNVEERTKIVYRHERKQYFVNEEPIDKVTLNVSVPEGIFVPDVTVNVSDVHTADQLLSVLVMLTIITGNQFNFSMPLRFTDDSHIKALIEMCEKLDVVNASVEIEYPDDNSDDDDSLVILAISPCQKVTNNNNNDDN